MSHNYRPHDVSDDLWVVPQVATEQHLAAWEPAENKAAGSAQSHPKDAGGWPGLILVKPKSC